jgi:phosphohistidine swiveling domain-containing protein
MVRQFCKSDAKEFHFNVSLKKLKKDPKCFSKVINDDFKLLDEVNKLKKVDKNNYLTVIDYFKQHFANFMNIISFGIVVGENPELQKNKEIKNAQKLHDLWRNKITFDETKLTKKFEKYLKDDYNNEKNIIQLITVKEFLKYKNNRNKLNTLIKTRKGRKLLYYNLNNNEGIITDNDIINKILEHNFSKEDKNIKELEGRVAFITNDFIEGEVLIIKTEKDLKKYKNADLVGKIIVALQTTPHYIPYIEKVKGIITDEGGITSHAAIVAREFKIPCIVGARIATKLLKTGQKVKMDLKSGKINIL